MPRSLLALLPLVFLLTACETSVAPRSDADRHFSLYGVVNPRADSQGVIVFPIQDELQTLDYQPLGATLRSTNLTTGETQTWRDSIVTGTEGPVHVYWSPFRAEYNHTYRLDVQGLAPEEASHVTVTVPPEAEIVPGPVLDGIYVTQEIAVTAPIERLNFLLVRYVIKARIPPNSLAYPELVPDERPVIGTAPPPPPPPDPTEPDTLIVQRLFVPIDYTEKATPEGDRWGIPVDFSADLREIRRRVSSRAGGREDKAFGIRLDEIQISLVAANHAWTAPNEQYETEVLIQPGTMSNVERGFGFVGAGYKLEHGYTLPDDVLVRIGFRLPD